MTDTKYVSLPGSESEAGQNSAAASSSIEDSSTTENEENRNIGNPENERMLVKERDEDTIVEMEEPEERWVEPSDYDIDQSENEQSLRPCLIIAAVLLLIWLIAAIIYYTLFGTKNDGGGSDTSKRIGFDDFLSGLYRPIWKELEWSATSEEDGVFAYRDNSKNIIMEHIADNSKKVLVSGGDIVDPYGEPIDYFSFEVSSDSLYVLLGTNQLKQWRYSQYANYWIFNITSKKTFPLVPDDQHAKIAYATWSPEGHSVAFVKNNDLYISIDLTEERRITFDGTDNVFNGVPDWIYEEEVFASNYALWWSPEGTKVAYIRFDETEVPEYRFPLYMKSFFGEPYTDEVVMKYPKPGYPNPRVTLHIYDIADSSVVEQSEAISIANDFDEHDRLITEVTWAGDNYLLVREMNRIQDIQRVVLVDVASRKGNTVREENAEEQDGGWFEIAQSIVYIPESDTHKKDSYIDLVNNNGYNHLALFSPIDSPNATFLTSGEWEVVDGVEAIDYDNEIIYYISTEKSSIERHIYSITFDGKHKTALTDTSKPGHYSVDFSPGTKYYNLKYEGPDLPWQKVLRVNESKFENILEDNTYLRHLLENKELPTIHRTSIISGGIEMNALEIRPPHMDKSGHQKYPVMFRVYGGPCSQLVDNRFGIDWHTYLVSSMNPNFIVVIVDGRGTGFKGRAFRVGVRNRLGELEATDVVNAGRYWCNLNYVDCDRIGIWGWSYGAYLTGKVVEANSGIFKLAIAVAPVTDWRFYDSIYTERYMKTPQLNRDGYRQSAIWNMTGFTAALVDRLTLASIHNYQVQFFTDSDHSMAKNNAYRELHSLMTKFLAENFDLKDR
ncbi:1220_t:CDS:10 [Ambispora gerdemannii]|uniref:1220_t:CDS:1 n=1 Tax=Ambispora gerdemannii TaxID=144530 RepID=A0A9N9C441_9GLOM|nr:1220_t:CDS:10 [Ambispora gerdemannii]